jgi:septal ring factor EnvC (AmiA/AmiB activator)
MTFTLPKSTCPRLFAGGCVTALVVALAPFALGQQQPAAQQEDAVTRYVRLLEEADAYASHAAHMQRMLASQQQQLASIEAQMASLDATSEQIGTLIERMYAELEAFIAADLPFHAETRQASIARLRDQILPSLETPISEKFRRLVEVYSIELEYGRTMEAYEGMVDGRAADIVRLGRVSLLYKTREGGEVGYWDRTQGAWVVNPRYTSNIEAALRVATEESVPDLIVVPVPTPDGGRS